MKNGKRLLPERWKVLMLVTIGAALAGNLLIRAVPWPEWMLSSYERGAAMEKEDLGRYLCMTLLLAPVVEEGIFRLLLYGRLLRDRLGVLEAAVLSSLAFGIYHGNWIQGVYGFLMGMILAWGYETSEYNKYPVAVVMHGAANLTVLAVFAR